MILFNWIQGDIMKKIIALMCVGLLAVSLTACKNDPQPTEVPNETEVHTLPPTENISDVVLILCILDSVVIVTGGCWRGNYFIIVHISLLIINYFFKFMKRNWQCQYICLQTQK